MPPVGETPFTFFEEPIETSFGNAIETPQMALCLIPKVLDAIDVMVLFADKYLTVIHTPMMKLGHIQHVIDLKAVRIRNTARQYFLANDGSQRRGFGVENDSRVHFPTSL